MAHGGCQGLVREGALGAGGSFRSPGCLCEEPYPAFVQSRPWLAYTSLVRIQKASLWCHLRSGLAWRLSNLGFLVPCPPSSSVCSGAICLGCSCLMAQPSPSGVTLVGVAALSLPEESPAVKPLHSVPCSSLPVGFHVH